MEVPEHAYTINLTMPQMVQQGLSYYNSGDFTNAVMCLGQVIAQDREQYDLARIYAKCLGHLLRMQECVDVLEYCAAKQPEHAGTAWMLANAYNEMGMCSHSRTYYERALALAPGTPLHNWTMALWYMKNRRYLKGLDMFKWGYHCKQRLSRHIAPEWDGHAADEPSDILYIAGEMGMGDNALFGRYIREAKARWGGVVVLEVHDIMIPLFTKGGAFHFDTGADAIVMQNENMEIRTPFKQWINLVSLGPTLYSLDEAFTRENGYKFVMPPRIEGEKRRVGLAWQGSSRNPSDRTRSLPLEAFLPFLRAPNIEFYSLQYGGEIPDGIPIIQPDISRTDKLAYWISQMDAVVTVDTLVANVAASMGVVTHVLSSMLSDYRWSGPTPSQSDFFPSAVVHRQTKWMNWQGPQQEIADALSALGETHGR